MIPMCSITLQLRHNCAHLRRNLRRPLLLRVVRSLRSQMCIKVRSQCGRNCGAIQQQYKVRVFHDNKHLYHNCWYALVCRAILFIKNLKRSSPKKWFSGRFSSSHQTFKFSPQCAVIVRNCVAINRLRAITRLRSQLCIKVRSQCGRNLSAISHMGSVRTVLLKGTDLFEQLIDRNWAWTIVSQRTKKRTGHVWNWQFLSTNCSKGSVPFKRTFQQFL